MKSNQKSKDFARSFHIALDQLLNSLTSDDIAFLKESWTSHSFKDLNTLSKNELLLYLKFGYTDEAFKKILAKHNG